MAEDEGFPKQGYRRVVTEDGRVVYIPARVEDLLVAARSVVSIRKGRQHPVVFEGMFLLNGSTVISGSNRFRIVSNDMNVDYLPDRETFVLDVNPVLSMNSANPALPARGWRPPKVRHKRRRR